MAYVSQGKENSSPQHQQESTKATSQIFSDNRETSNATPSLQAMMANSPQQQKLKATAQMMTNSPAQQRLNSTSPIFVNKPEPLQRMEDEEPLQGKFETEPAQLEAAAEAPRPNNTGLPDNLKSGIENLSGMSMDHVKVHYNSDKPAQLQAHAYAQGSEIHVAPGQEQHLPHEAWHVVQQAQGRVKPTMQMKGDLQVNDDVGLESEADVMGGKALQMVIARSNDITSGNVSGRETGIIQRATVTVRNQTDDYNSGWVQAETQSTGVEAGPQSEAQRVQAIAGGEWLGGHMVNDRLGGGGGYANIVPITASMNNQHHTIENQAQQIVGNLGTRNEVRYRMNILRRTNHVFGENNEHQVNNLANRFQQHYDYRTKEVQAGGTQSRPIPYQAPGNITSVNGEVLDMDVN